MTATVYKQHPLSLAAGTFVLEVSADPNGLSYAAGSVAVDRSAAAPHSGLWFSYGSGTWKQAAAWLDDLADVTTANQAANAVLAYDGTAWKPASLSVSGGSVVVTFL